MTAVAGGGPGGVGAGGSGHAGHVLEPVPAAAAASILPRTGWTVTADSAESGVALPGYYLLFALDSAGVPSVAATVRIV